MSTPRLKIHLGGACLLSALSRSENGILAFEEDAPHGDFHNASRALSALITPKLAELLSTLESTEMLLLEIALVEHATLLVMWGEAQELVVGDGRSWWIPLDQITLGDILEEAGLMRFAETIDVANPFGVVA